MSEEELNKAYQIVFEDIVKNGPQLFQGVYDAKHGKDSFMFGIKTVLDYIADKCPMPAYQNFDDIFWNNIIKSQQEKGR